MQSSQAFERKILRKIIGTIKGNDEWHIRWNDELDQLIKGKIARPCNERGRQESTEENCRGHSIHH